MSVVYHYVVVRADLPRGAQAAQIVHAAGESVVDPVPTDARAVVLTCPDEATLSQISEKLEHSGIKARRIVETEGGFAGQLVALGVAPTPKTEAVAACLGGLPILK